jgi:hypothetical protein
MTDPAYLRLGQLPTLSPLAVVGAAVRPLQADTTTDNRAR